MKHQIYLKVEFSFLAELIGHNHNANGRCAISYLQHPITDRQHRGNISRPITAAHQLFNRCQQFSAAIQFVRQFCYIFYILAGV